MPWNGAPTALSRRFHDSQHGATPGPTTVGQLIRDVERRNYKPIRPYVIQLSMDGQRLHHPIGLADVTEWWTVMFGTHTRPQKSVWYTVPQTLWAGMYDDDGYDNWLKTILFDADGYAQNEFERHGVDPRQKQFRGTASTRLFQEHEPIQHERSPDIEDAVHEAGTPAPRCEICFEEWGATCVAESPLLHEWKTCCRHWACRECWLKLEKKRCPWCGWNITGFLGEIAADPVAPRNAAMRVTFGPWDESEQADTTDPTNEEQPRMAQVGWLYASSATLECHAERITDYENDICFEFALNGYGVCLTDKMYRKDVTTAQTWGVACMEYAADVVLDAIASMGFRVTKCRSPDRRWVY